MLFAWLDNDFLLPNPLTDHGPWNALLHFGSQGVPHLLCGLTVPVAGRIDDFVEAFVQGQHLLNSRKAMVDPNQRLSRVDKFCFDLKHDLIVRYRERSNPLIDCKPCRALTLSAEFIPYPNSADKDCGRCHNDMDDFESLFGFRGVQVAYNEQQDGDSCGENKDVPTYPHAEIPRRHST